MKQTVVDKVLKGIMKLFLVTLKTLCIFSETEEDGAPKPDLAEHCGERQDEQQDQRQDEIHQHRHAQE